MSEANHPNINAAAFSADVTKAFYERLRGDAANNLDGAFDVFREKVVNFISDLSEALDHRFEN